MPLERRANRKKGEKRRKTSSAEEKGRSHPLFPLRRPSNLGRGRKIETQEPETRTRDGPSETNIRAGQRERERGGGRGEKREKEREKRSEKREKNEGREFHTRNERYFSRVWK